MQFCQCSVYLWELTAKSVVHPPCGTIIWDEKGQSWRFFWTTNYFTFDFWSSPLGTSQGLSQLCHSNRTSLLPSLVLQTVSNSRNGTPTYECKRCYGRECILQKGSLITCLLRPYLLISKQGFSLPCNRSRVGQAGKWKIFLAVWQYNLTVLTLFMLTCGCNVGWLQLASLRKFYPVMSSVAHSIVIIALTWENGYLARLLTCVSFSLTLLSGFRGWNWG